MLEIFLRLSNLVIVKLHEEGFNHVVEKTKWNSLLLVVFIIDVSELNRFFGLLEGDSVIGSIIAQLSIVCILRIWSLAGIHSTSIDYTFSNICANLLKSLVDDLDPESSVIILDVRIDFNRVDFDHCFLIELDLEKVGVELSSSFVVQMGACDSLREYTEEVGFFLH